MTAATLPIAGRRPAPPAPIPSERPSGGRSPIVRRVTLAANRFVVVPTLRAGVGPLLSTPWTGSIMLLGSRGRRSGAWRYAPLNYVIRDGNVYCCAGFGRSTQWLKNLQSDPRVELTLPGRSVSGEASIVDDPDELELAMCALLDSMRLIALPVVGDPRRAGRQEILAVAAEQPLVRIRTTGLAPGPWDPGGRGWMLTLGLSGVLAGRWLLRRFRPSGGRC